MRYEQRSEAQYILRAQHTPPDEDEEQREADTGDNLRVHERDIRERHDRAAHFPAQGVDAERGHRAEQRGDKRAAYGEDEGIREQAQRVAVREEVEVVVKGEALELAQIAPVVEGADEEDYHRRVEEEQHYGRPYLAGTSHIVATSSSSPEKRFMRPIETNTSSMSMRLMAAPRLRLSEPLNCVSMMSPTMMFSVAPSFCEM